MKAVVCIVAVLSVIGCAASIGKGAQAQGHARAAAPLDGEQLFKSRCSGCHVMDEDGKGPRLRGVYGRRAGAVRWDGYSSGMRLASFAWDDYKLDKWLTDPDSVVNVSNMEFKVRKKEEREAIIGFLKSDAAR